jgi:hypothetical protein
LSTTYQQALSYTAAGYSILPIKIDGSKRPCLKEWEPYQRRQPTSAEVGGWYGNGAMRGIGLICGEVSGNLEVVDVDAPELNQQLLELIEAHAPGLPSKLTIVETPRDGRHLAYKCVEIAGNQKLALREVELGEITDEEAKQQKAYRRKSDGKWCNTITLIETRGEGGYIVVPGSPGRCHLTGREYRLLQGDFSAVPTITPQERAVILACARSFNEFVKESQEQKVPSLNNGLKPGADFNERGDVGELLKKHGWQECGKSDIGTRWMRPGGDRPSATLFNDSRKFWVHSTNAAPLDFDHAYAPFALLTALEYKGDFAAAAKALTAQGYGEQTKAKETKQPVKARVGDVTFTVVEDGDRPGVYATDANGNRDFICSRLYIEADTRDEYNENWGRLLKLLDRDGVWHQWATPMSLLSGDGREYRAWLLDLGLEIDAKRKARTLLETYLNTNPNKKALCVTKQGWHRGAFVMPDETIGENGEPIYLQTLSRNHLFRQAGGLDDWREQVGQYCAGNSRLVLAASVAFAAPLLEPLQGENGGWHFTGGSSKGKTTALYVAGSVHGGGGDKGYIRRWRATINVMLSP